jgi:release factor glutamine methyltransferase
VYLPDSIYIFRVTVLEGIQKSAGFLLEREIESPRLQAELLLAHVLKLPRMQLYLKFDRVLSSAEQDELRELIRRRGRREPLQHLVGSTSFCGLEMRVNRHVLIPRPETELLAEAGWQFLNQSSVLDPVNSRDSAAGNEELPAAALDFGTGSGCIAIALAVNCPNSRISAIDISPEALDVASQNARTNAVSDRIEFLPGDGFAALNKPRRYDLIITNPPYIPGSEIESLQPEVRQHDPRLALDGGSDGLDFFRRLAAEAPSFLKSNGRLMLEFGDGQAQLVQNIFGKQNWVVEAVREDYTRRPRILIAKIEPVQRP